MRRLIATACVAIVLLGGLSSSLHAAPYAGAWTSMPYQPPINASAHVIYDPAGARMLALQDGVLYQLSLAGVPVWSVLPTSGAPPSNGNSIALDTVRNRIVLFSSEYASTSTLWALPLAAPTWTDITPPGAGPSPRNSASCLYDPVRDRLLIYGGYRVTTGGTYIVYSDTWQVPFGVAPSWSAISTAGAPPPRFSCGVIYDPVRDRMVICAGGIECCGLNTNEMRALTLSGTPTWSQIITSGPLPPARTSPMTIYDPFGDRLVMAGGNGGDTRTWSFPFVGPPTWSEIPTTTIPEQLGEAIYDPVNQRLVMHGAKTWALTLTGPPVWSGLFSEPLNINRYASSYDSKRDRMIVAAQETWSLALEAPQWTLLNNAPSFFDHVQIYDPVRDRTLVTGGYRDGSASNEVWQLPGGTSTWSQIFPVGAPPSPHGGAAAIYDPVGDRMIMFGGSGFPPYNELWELRLAGIPTWYQLTPAGTLPPGRKDHVAVYDSFRQRMVIFGGQGNPASLNDVWALDLAANPMTWEQLFPAGTPPSGRFDAAGAYVVGDDALLIYGGYSGFGDTWRLSLSPPMTWTELAPTGIPASVAAEVTGIFDHDHKRMVVFGRGFTTAKAWSLDWTGVTTAVEPANAPRPLSIAAAPSMVDHGHDLIARIVLPSDALATLRVYDLVGRVVASRGLRALGPGPHDVTMSELARHPAGVYLLRLDQAGHSAQAKAVLLR
jgi:hypothetical protein